MNGYATEGWDNLFVCAGGATAALSGLIFVSLSVNIRTVLDLEKKDGRTALTGRAAEALSALLIVLGISLVALTPGIGPGVLAAYILLSCAGSLVSPLRALSAGGAQAADLTTTLRLVNAAALSVTLLTAGITLAAGAGGGLYWLPVAFVVAIAVAAVNSWVLLVEVLR